MFRFTNLVTEALCLNVPSEQKLLVRKENKFRRLNSLKNSSFGRSKTFPPTPYSGPVCDIMRHLGPCMLPWTHLLLSSATAFTRPSWTLLFGYQIHRVWHPI